MSPLVDIRPPATRRVLKTLADRTSAPAIVVLLDGAFFHQPAPTHYDLLYLLRAGIRVIGASSMGALRAAELRHRGMVGMGIVYEAVVSGLITDDAEVAVAMCPLTYRAQTIPLVRVRCVLHFARNAGLAERDASAAFERARRIHFLGRTPDRLADSWKAAVPDAADPLVTLLGKAETDVKASDARLAIQYAIDATDLGVTSERLMQPPASARPLPLWA